MGDVIPFPRAKIVRLANVPHRTSRRGTLVSKCSMCFGTGREHKNCGGGWIVPVIVDMPSGEDYYPACKTCAGTGVVR